MRYNKWAIFYKDGSIRTINAYDFTWDEGDKTLSFSDYDDTMIACFKLDKIDGVAMVQEDVNLGIEEPIAQLPAPDITWVPSPWTPSDSWQPSITWCGADIKPLAERGTE